MARNTQNAVRISGFAATVQGVARNKALPVWERGIKHDLKALQRAKLFSRRAFIKANGKVAFTKMVKQEARRRILLVKEADPKSLSSPKKLSKLFGTQRLLRKLVAAAPAAL